MRLPLSEKCGHAFKNNNTEWIFVTTLKTLKKLLFHWKNPDKSSKILQSIESKVPCLCVYMRVLKLRYLFPGLGLPYSTSLSWWHARKMEQILFSHLYNTGAWWIWSSVNTQGILRALLIIYLLPLEKNNPHI